MKKAIFMAIAAILITGLLVAPSMAKGKKFNAGGKGPSGPAGKSNIGHLYLYEKYEDDWEIVEGGMWGKMKYNLSGPTFDFVFNGHGLPINQDFTLIYYPDSLDNSWPAEGIICLESGTVMDVGDDSGGGGDIHIQGSADIGDLPKDYDANYKPDEAGHGAKIWLVQSEDVNCDSGIMAGWSPGAILFEGALITYEDTDEVDED